MTKKRYRQGKKVHIRSTTWKLLMAGLVTVCLGVVLFAILTVVKSVGRQSLKNHALEVADSSLVADLNDEEAEDGSKWELKEGQILVNGEVYEYNRELLTFLCMGVDSRSGIEKTQTPGTAGQADALFLAIINPGKESLRVIPINRDTMTDIEIYDTAGMYLEKEKGQIALQYAYGDGREKSCLLMEQAVSALFYGIPIHGYAALDMESIAALNDAVGGVDVTLPEDMTKFKAGWKKGTKVHLTGEDALLFVQRRDTAYMGTNLGRVERQKQYLTAYVEKLKEKTKEDFTFPVTLYGTLAKHAVTSLTVQEITYLADLLVSYDFSMDDIMSIPGESKMGEIHEEFYIDETALKELTVEVFYEKKGQE